MNKDLLIIILAVALFVKSWEDDKIIHAFIDWFNGKVTQDKP